ncbi:hypothetical protein [Streptomyces sp. MMS20-AI2-20]|uniref:hypothetical protein n=1 Tax=Streptomyces sp. MMS20-AI2-20 TaxID=2925835 RepID=UPI001F609B66|nr:hypothetical protein [Streptomyces sp. MMS20-AI2-20]MCI4145772.1 hypothetical protein [Streptomyces sp. MMS20-AI2-20]
MSTGAGAAVGAAARTCGYLELSAITWTLETIPTADFHTMPTGESEAGLIEHFAQHPVHWVTVRPPQVGSHWEDHRTWLRPPLLIDRRLLKWARNRPRAATGTTDFGGSEI